MIKCVSCGESKSRKEYYSDKRNKSGIQGCCKECFKNRQLAIRRSIYGCASKIFTHQRRKSKLRKHNPPSYSRKEFVSWCKSNSQFLKLHNEWKLSNYKTELVPSIDRLNDNIGYGFDNIQVITWEENNNLGHKRERLGINKSKLRSVMQISKNGKEIKSYHSMKEAERKTGINNGNISNCCSGRQNSAGGFIWRYLD